jgi:hypothetical protein
MKMFKVTDFIMHGITRITLICGTVCSMDA